MQELILSHPYFPMAASALLGFLVATFFYLNGVHPLARKSLEKKFRERKNEFIALASHYLITPITIIQTAVTRLQEKDATLTGEERAKLYDSILMGEQRLWMITEQLILVNEIDQNNLQVNIAVSNLSETVTSAIASLDVFARNKKIKIHFLDQIKDIQEARYDERRIKQAIVAIIDNAIKFSVEDSGIRVRLGLQSGIITIEVEDQGSGMPPEILKHLAEKFYRGSSLYTFDHEGAGLGLFIAQAILRQHQGLINFESQAKRGTRVTIHFPTL